MFLLLICGMKEMDERFAESPSGFYIFWFKVPITFPFEKEEDRIFFRSLLPHSFLSTAEPYPLEL